MKPDAIERTVQKTNTWLHGISSNLHTRDERVAYHALRAVLHALRDRMSVDEAAAFGAQLPMLVRGLYYEGWHPHGKPLRIRHGQQFLELVSAYLNDDAEVALDPKPALDAVMDELKAQIDPGEMLKMLQSLPVELQMLLSG